MGEDILVNDLLLLVPSQVCLCDYPAYTSSSLKHGDTSQISSVKYDQRPYILSIDTTTSLHDFTPRLTNHLTLDHAFTYSTIEYSLVQFVLPQRRNLSTC